MIFASDLVDWHALWQVIYISAGAGLLISISMGIAVVASLRAQDDRAAGREGSAIGLTAVAVVGVAVVVAAVVLGIYYITSK
jgi:hypothetical protein